MDGPFINPCRVSLNSYFTVCKFQYLWPLKDPILFFKAPGAVQSCPRCISWEIKLISRFQLIICHPVKKYTLIAAMLNRPVAPSHRKNTLSLTNLGEYCWQPRGQSDQKWFEFWCTVVVCSCLLDSKTNSGASHFVSRTDRTLRFSLKAFQFTSDPETEVSDIKTPWIRQSITPLWVFRSVFTAHCLSHLRIQVLHRSPAPTERTGKSYQAHTQNSMQNCFLSARVHFQVERADWWWLHMRMLWFTMCDLQIS